jgi:hypothetical protein
VSLTEEVHIAGVPAMLAASATIAISGVPDPVVLPLKLQPVGGQIALIIDPGPALDAVIEAEAKRDEGDPPPAFVITRNPPTDR